MVIMHIITGLSRGGAEASLFKLVANDFNSSHVIVSFTGGGVYENKLRCKNIQLYSLNLNNMGTAFFEIKKLWHILKRTKPDIVQTWMYHADLIGGIVARLQGHRVFWGVRHSDLSIEANKLSTLFVVRACALLSYIIPIKIIYCADQAANSHKAIGYAKNKARVIPNGYSFEHYAPSAEQGSAIRVELGLEKYTMPVLGMVGRFHPQKDHYNLISSLAKLKKIQIDFKCVLVGKAINHKNTELSQWIHQYGLCGHVILLDQREDVHSIMNALDLHVLSSIGEAFPNVLAEAMACGTPCVTTDVGDAASIVGDVGWVVPPSDSQALAGAILAAIQEKEHDPDAWQVRKLAARQRIIDHYSMERVVAAYNQVWREAEN